MYLSKACLAKDVSKVSFKIIDLLRHAQTDFNAEIDKISKNISINEIGKQQCQSQKILKNYDTVICSPMNRCKETLFAIKGITYNELIYSSLCREHKIHNCDFLEEEDETILETEEDLCYRVEQFKKFLSQFQDKNILVVSHGDFLWYFTSKIVQGEKFGQWLENCQIYEFHMLTETEENS